MQTKIYNAYRLTHKNGSVEDVNALDLVQALENMEIPETESKVLQAFLVKEGVRTLIEDEPTEIIFSAVVAEGGTGSIATPASGKIHAGDMIQLKAVPARNYAFVSWSLNGVVISNEATLNFTMPELEGGLDTAIFTATFALAPVAWTTSVSPSEAKGLTHHLHILKSTYPSSHASNVTSILKPSFIGPSHGKFPSSSSLLLIFS